MYINKPTKLSNSTNDIYLASGWPRYPYLSLSVSQRPECVVMRVLTDCWLHDGEVIWWCADVWRLEILSTILPHTMSTVHCIVNIYYITCVVWGRRGNLDIHERILHLAMPLLAFCIYYFPKIMILSRSAAALKASSFVYLTITRNTLLT